MIDISKVQYSDEWNNTVNGFYEKYYDFTDSTTVKELVDMYKSDFDSSLISNGFSPEEEYVPHAELQLSYCTHGKLSAGSISVALGIGIVHDAVTEVLLVVYLTAGTDYDTDEIFALWESTGSKLDN